MGADACDAAAFDAAADADAGGSGFARAHHHRAPSLTTLRPSPTPAPSRGPRSASYLFQPENALACDTFIDDASDRELFVLMDFLEQIRTAPDVRLPLQQWAAGQYELAASPTAAGRARLAAQAEGGGGGGGGAWPGVVWAAGKEGDEEEGVEEEAEAEEREERE